MKLTRHTWDRLSTAERNKQAKQIAKELPEGFAFESLRDCTLGTQKNTVAFFKQGKSEFALIPATTATIGYDATRLWEPTEDEAESWRDSREEGYVNGSIKKHIQRVTRRPKAVNIPTLLVETSAGEFGWEPIVSNDPRVLAILKEHPGSQRITAYHGEEGTRITRLPRGKIQAERMLRLTHAELNESLRKSGYRLPTSDEWEYLCGAGAQTLFRWGDHAPGDHYPIDQLKGKGAWSLHTQANALGLVIAHDPYKNELVGEVGRTRGGDGGCAICGGAGFFLGWLTLATAYSEKEACRHDPAEPIAVDYRVARRVLELT